MIQMKSNNRSVTSKNQQTLQTRLRLFIRDKEAPVWTGYPKVNLTAHRLGKVVRLFSTPTSHKYIL